MNVLILRKDQKVLKDGVKLEELKTLVKSLVTSILVEDNMVKLSQNKVYLAAVLGGFYVNGEDGKVVPLTNFFQILEADSIIEEIDKKEEVKN